MKSSKIQRSFILSYVALFVVVVATGFVVKNFPTISADTATTTTQNLNHVDFSASVDGNATIQFTGKTYKVVSADYKGVTGATISGDLTGCTTVGLSGDTTGRVALTSSSSPFTIKVKDNGSGTPPPYSFSLFCVKPVPTGVAALSKVHFEATVDGNAKIQFTGSTYKVISADYKGASGISITGNLTGCTKTALTGETTGRVYLTSSASPFTVKIVDNGSGTPPPYKFDLVCVIPLKATSTTTATVTSTNSVTAYSVTLKHGFNTIAAPNDSGVYDAAVLGTSPITDAGMYIYDFNRLGQKAWRSTAKNNSIPYFFNQVGYYVYNPGNEQTLSLTVNPSAHQTTNEEKIKVRRGWNLMSIAATNVDRKLSEYHINTLKKGVDNTCVTDSCFTQVTLRDLLAGDPATSRAYNYIFEIVDSQTTDATKAFKSVKIDSTNIDTVTIPAKTVFWLYLFE